MVAFKINIKKLQENTDTYSPCAKYFTISILTRFAISQYKHQLQKLFFYNTLRIVRTCPLDQHIPQHQMEAGPLTRD